MTETDLIKLHDLSPARQQHLEKHCLDSLWYSPETCSNLEGAFLRAIAEFRGLGS